MDELAARIDASLHDLLRRRAPTSSICPSDVARALAPAGDWRALMPAVRERAGLAAHAGRLRLTRGGVELDPADPGRGPIRIARGPGFEPPGS